MTHTCDSAYNTGQELKQKSSSQSLCLENNTCQSPDSVLHNGESTTQTDGRVDISTPSKTVMFDASWLSSQDECKHTEEVTSDAKPQ